MASPSGVQTTATQCPYCGVGCGLLADVEDGRLKAVRGDPIHPANRGRTCRKPLGLPFAVGAPDRATVPLWREDRDARFKPTSWEDVLGTVAGRMRAIIDEHGPDAVAFYISGQLLTEDYYAVNKLAKGFLGTNNVDSNSRLCMSSAVAGYTGAFGFDGPPPAYADIALADCFLLLGTNTAACHPIVWSRIRDRQAEGAFVICADPRATATAQCSDLHLPVRPGTDLALLSAMLHVVDRDGLLAGDFVARHTSGWEHARSVAREWTPERAAEVCGVSAELIEEAARRFAGAGGAMALWSMGANQSTVGTLKNRALINLCLATGQIGRPGSGPLSLTGQPNAMGGRETGGVAHLLPGYRKVTDDEDRAAMAAHWGVDVESISDKPGLPAVALFDALEEGRVKAVWIMATNPLVSLPDSQRARSALERAELVIVQDPHHPTETSSLAHAVLPAAAWPEKEGTMTSSERRIGLVRRVVAPPGEARPDWHVIAALARHLGYGDAFAWPHAAAVFDEFAACTAGRPWRDADALAATPPATRCVVVGGGLLGLEAAAGLHARGIAVTVVELGGHLMNMQLDAGASAILRRDLERQGIACMLGRSAARIESDRVVLDDGSELECSRVVVAAGVRAETTLARAAGLECEHGIVVDDELRASAPGVWAVGECAEHRGTVYGLWGPLAEQARVAGARIAGDPGAFHGAVHATTLKVSGVDVYAGGVSAGTAPSGHDEIVLSDTRSGTYRRLVLDGNKLTGGVLVGDTSAAQRLSELLSTGADIPSDLLEPGGAPAQPLAADPAATICSCNAVTVGEVQTAVHRDDVSTVAQVGTRTGATTGCGGCTTEVQELLAATAPEAES